MSYNQLKKVFVLVLFSNFLMSCTNRPATINELLDKCAVPGMNSLAKKVTPEEEAKITEEMQRCMRENKGVRLRYD